MTDSGDVSEAVAPLLDEKQTVLLPLKARERLFREGDAATAVFFIESGTLPLERRTIDGRMVIVHTGRAGQFFAEAALFSSHYHCDALAVSAAMVRAYPKGALKRALAEDHGKAERFMAILAKEIQALRLRLELRSVRPASERLRQFLEFTADQNTGVVKLTGDLQDIAAEIGLTREALYRTIARAERIGFLKRTPGAIYLLGRARR
jgi:CRP/FNR family transcriptional regulator, dissimilatory nitrate respiration regulator